jgi:hypothetical protein
MYTYQMPGLSTVHTSASCIRTPINVCRALHRSQTSAIMLAGWAMASHWQRLPHYRAYLTCPLRRCAQCLLTWRSGMASYCWALGCKHTFSEHLTYAQLMQGIDT